MLSIDMTEMLTLTLRMPSMLMVRAPSSSDAISVRQVSRLGPGWNPAKPLSQSQ